MLKKRLVGVVTVRQGWAVQSIGYRQYLPLGRPEVLVENLDRWGADEILLQCIDRSCEKLGPDFALLERLSRIGLSTPLIYAGGIRSAADAVAVVKAGADRVAVDSLLHDAADRAGELAGPLGAQAVIASLPLRAESGQLLWYDHRDGSERPLTREVQTLLRTGSISEALIIDWRNEGRPTGFDPALVRKFPVENVPLLVFGGLSEPDQLRSLLQGDRVVAGAIGNFLSYREHAVQQYKKALAGLPLRTAVYQQPRLVDQS